MRGHTLAEAIRSGVGTERPFLCPVHGDSRPSASVNVLKMVWICYTCGAHGEVTGNALLGDISIDALRQYIDAGTAEEQVYPEAWLNQFDSGPVHEYWLGRFSEEAARHFRLGFDYEMDRATYPLRGPSGTIHGVVSRNMTDHGPKYLYPKGIDIGTLLFNYDPSWETTVVLVEGAMDAVALWEAGVPAMAIYGSRFSLEQLMLLEKKAATHIICAFDNDKAGWEAFMRVRAMAKPMKVSRAVWPLSWGKDVAELSVEQRRNIFEKLDFYETDQVGSDTCKSPLMCTPILSPPAMPPMRPTRG